MLARLAHLLLGLWIGAVACTAFAVAPNVFGIVEDRKLAGDVMLPIFRTVDAFGIAAAAMFVLAAWGRRVRAGLAALAGIAAAVNLFVLAPRIAARAEGFERLHALSTGLWTGILVAGLVLLWLGPAPRSGGASR